MKQDDSKQLKVARKEWVKKQNFLLKVFYYTGMLKVWFTWKVHPKTYSPQYWIEPIRHEKFRMIHPLMWVAVLFTWILWSLSFWWKDEGFKEVFSDWN